MQLRWQGPPNAQEWLNHKLVMNLYSGYGGNTMIFWPCPNPSYMVNVGDWVIRCFRCQDEILIVCEGFCLRGWCSTRVNWFAACSDPKTAEKSFPSMILLQSAHHRRECRHHLSKSTCLFKIQSYFIGRMTLFRNEDCSHHLTHVHAHMWSWSVVVSRECRQSMPRGGPSIPR